MSKGLQCLQQHPFTTCISDWPNKDSGIVQFSNQDLISTITLILEFCLAIARCKAFEFTLSRSKRYDVAKRDMSTIPNDSLSTPIIRKSSLQAIVAIRNWTRFDF